MSRIHLNIDRLVLHGFGPSEAKALSAALQSQLHQVLLDRTNREHWARSHRTPVLKLGRVTLEAGASGAGKLGKQLAGAIGKGLKP